MDLRNAIQKRAAEVSGGDPVFEKLTETTYVSSDWRYAIEREGGEWVLKENGKAKRAFSSLDEAIAWTIAWDKGEATR